MVGVRLRVGMVCAVNTCAGTLGALAAGFLVIPAWGLQQALSLVSVLLLVAGSAVFSQPSPGEAFRALGAAVAAPSGV